MIIEEAIAKIEQGLMGIEENQLIILFSRMFPEESLGLINSNNDFKEEIVQLIIENVECDKSSLSKLYKKIFGEKILLEEDYQEEEQEQWQ